MSYEDPDAPVTPSRRSPRQGVGGSPMGSTVSIVLAVVAVVVGFLILNNITDDGSSAGGDASGVPTDSTPEDTTASSVVADTTTTTTEPPLVTEGATVVVANASGVPGSAGRMTTELETLGFVMAEAANSTQTGLVASKVQYVPSIAAAQAVAESVARSMGGLTVEAVPTPPPIEGGSLNGAGVLVLLGTDEADKTIAQLSAPVASVAPAPDVSGDTTGDTTAGTTGATTGDTTG
jgi:hypothetical protein